MADRSEWNKNPVTPKFVGRPLTNRGSNLSGARVLLSSSSAKGSNSRHGQVSSTSTGRVGVLLMALLSLCYSTEAQTTGPQKSFAANESVILNEFRSIVTDRREGMRGWYGDDPCNVSTGESTFTGVQCGPSNTIVHVSSIDLHGLDLRGEAARCIGTLGNLSSLQELDLSDNRFYGPLPQDFPTFPWLRTLRLPRNALNGTIPSLPKNLRVLSLYNNRLSGDLSNLTFLQNLVQVDVHSNGLSGSLPDIRHLNTTILSYDVSENQLNGPIPAKLSRVMYYLNLSFNDLTGQIPFTRGDNWFETVDLSSNQLNGTIPNSFLQSSWLRYLNCSNNFFTGSINLTDVRMYGSANVLDLSHNQLDSMTNMSDLLASTLEVLCLQNNKLSGDMSAYFPKFNFSRLRELRLSNNNLSLTFKPEAEVRAQSNFPVLEVLDLSKTELVDPVSVGLHRIPTLKELLLQDNCFTSTGIGPDTKWTNLEVLDLSRTCFSNVTDLQTIFTKCTKLRELRLGNNDFSALPMLSGNLSSLEILDLSNSQLQGSLPSLFKNLTMPSLKYLDLSRNQLSGILESNTFASWREFTHFNVSNNRLSGRIPSLEGNVALSNPTFFLGNTLCGFPLSPCHDGAVTLQTWQLVVVILSLVISGIACLSFGFMWRRRVYVRQHKQDAALIEALLDRDVAVMMPLRDLRNATDNFSDDLQIGRGGFGTVYKGTLEGGTLVAVKKSNRDGSSEDKFQFLNEVKILSKVHHKNLVCLLGCCLANKIALLVFEFIPNGTLEEHLQRKRGESPLTWRQRLQIAVQTADALDYLHCKAKPPIYHLDIKSANILLDENLNAKVADFGISKLAPSPDSTHVTSWENLRGTPGYMDPETLLSSILSGKSDVYALGVVLLELITAQPAVDRARAAEGVESNLARRATVAFQSGNLEDMVDPTIMETFLSAKGKESILTVAKLATVCLNLESKWRPTMEEVLRDLRDAWRWLYVPQSLSLDLNDDSWGNTISNLDAGWNFATVR